MKKHKLLSISAVIMMLSAYGCSLDEFNPSGISTEQEWSTPAGYEKKVNDCYFDLVRIVYGQAEDTYLMVAEGGTDIWQDTNPDGTNGNWSKLLRYEDYGASNGMLNEGYAGFYGILSACNAAVHYADKVEGGNTTALTDSESKTYLEKAKAAADYLIQNAASLGVKLYDDVEAVFDENNNKNNEEALFIVCHSTITAYNPRGNYFNRVWKHSEAYNNNTSGIYLSGMTPSYATNINGYEVPKLAKGNCYMEPSKYMLDLYGEKDGRYKAFFKDTYYVNNATNSTKNGYTWNEADAQRYGLSTSRVGNSAYDITLGDTAVYLSRKTYTQAERNACRYAIFNLEDNYADTKSPLKFFPSLKKADCPSLYAGSNASKPYSSADCIVYRLGETYLISAEIDWRLGNNQSAAERLNTLRNRACKGHDHSMDITASEVTQDFLLDEYAREMIGEWNRWMTLKRFRAFESRITKANPQITKFDKNIHYLRPIPTAELLLIDNANEYQNPGY